MAVHQVSIPKSLGDASLHGSRSATALCGTCRGVKEWSREYGAVVLGVIYRKVNKEKEKN